MAGEPSLTSDPTGSGGRGHRVVQEEPLDVILSPELDKMVTDGEIKAKSNTLYNLESKFEKHLTHQHYAFCSRCHSQ